MSRAAEGYASVAAIAALAVLGGVTYLISTSDRTAVAALAADTNRAQMEAAAQAGVDMAVRGLAATQPEQRWAIQGAVHRLQFEQFDLQVAVEDEHGKLSLSDINEPAAIQLFEDLGLGETPATEVAESLLDWVDYDHDPRPEGAEDAAYLRVGLRPRNQAPLSLDELIRVRGMTPQILARLKPLITAKYDATGGFDATNASSIATAVMAVDADTSSQAIQQRIDRSAGRLSEPFGPTTSLVGRRLTVDVTVQGERRLSFRKRCLIELAGSSSQPYVIRSCDAPPV